MKGRFEIKVETRKQEALLQNLKDKYSRMHLIDMQSGDGNKMRAEMNRIQGFVEGLEWCIKED